MLAVIGITGPADDAVRRTHLRAAWRSASAVAPRDRLVLRFAVSKRDLLNGGGGGDNISAATWLEADVVLLDCLGQKAGNAVVELALAHSWYTFAVKAFRQAAYVGRADMDLAIAPRWLGAVLRSSLQLQRRSGRPHQYVGRVQFYSWHRRDARPVGWGGSWRHAKLAAREEAAAEGVLNTSTASLLDGPFPFVTGPLILLSASLARWYAASAPARLALAAAIESRRRSSPPLVGDVVGDASPRSGSSSSSSSSSSSRGGGGGGGGGGSARAAPIAVASFQTPSNAGDTRVRLFDDVFLGHALCFGRAANVTMIAFPRRAIRDGERVQNARAVSKRAATRTRCTHYHAPNTCTSYSSHAMLCGVLSRVYAAPGMCNKGCNPCTAGGAGTRAFDERRTQWFKQCCLRALKRTTSTAVHQLKLAPWLAPDISRVLDARAPRRAPLRCEALRERVRVPPDDPTGLTCGHSWQVCGLPPLMKPANDDLECGRPPT